MSALDAMFAGLESAFYRQMDRQLAREEHVEKTWQPAKAALCANQAFVADALEYAFEATPALVAAVAGADDFEAGRLLRKMVADRADAQLDEVWNQNHAHAETPDDLVTWWEKCRRTAEASLRPAQPHVAASLPAQCGDFSTQEPQP